MTDPAALTHWFTTSIPALMQNAGKENRVCSPLNIYMALSMLAAVTGGETRQQILSALGASLLDAQQKQATALGGKQLGRWPRPQHAYRRYPGWG